MKAKKVPSVRSSAPETALRLATTRIDFTPQKVVAGICFHLCDEGLATEVAVDSMRRSELRMTRERLELSILREHWESMEHRERLNWLMTQSHTVMSLAPGGIATLQRNDEA